MSGHKRMGDVGAGAGAEEEVIKPPWNSFECVWYKTGYGIVLRWVVERYM